MKKQSILFLCAHNDDHIIGAGGTIIKYAKDGNEIFTIVFSYGESSHPHFKREFAVQMRVKESFDAAKILGEERMTYLGLKEGRFLDDFKRKRLARKLRNIINEKQPTKIFTHSVDDPHPDHQAVYGIVTQLVDKMRFKGDVYCFDVWNPITITTRSLPRLVVDISDTFGLKMKAMRAHKSQILARLSLFWNLYAKAFLNGMRYDVRYAEVFYKIR